MTTTESLLICLDSHRRWYEAATAQADLEKDTAHEADQVKDGIWSIEEARRFLLADALKDYFETEIDDLPQDRWQDAAVVNLVSSAIADVDWHEVADHYLSIVAESRSVSALTANRRPR